MSRSVVCIAGPFAEDETLNIARARVLGIYAVRLGLAPVVPHLSGNALFGLDAVPENRKAALFCREEIAALLAAGGADLWVILRDDGSMSEGTSREHSAWADSARGGSSCSLTWEEWGRRMTKTGHNTLWRSA